MSLHAAMLDACKAVAIVPPRRTKLGQWVQCPVEGKGPSNGSGRVLLFDNGKGGICWNWATGQQQRFSDQGLGGLEVKAPPRDPEAERSAEAERREVMDACNRIVAACQQAEHPYLARKGFPTECGLVIADPRPLMPKGDLGDELIRALPEGDGPLLIIPGRVDGKITTLQFITPDGVKKNIKKGVMQGARHRLSLIHI